MPSVNSKRQVSYTLADVNTLAGAVTLLEFMESFEESQPSMRVAETRKQLQSLCDFLKQRRAEGETKQG